MAVLRREADSEVRRPPGGRGHPLRRTQEAKQHRGDHLPVLLPYEEQQDPVPGTAQA